MNYFEIYLLSHNYKTNRDVEDNCDGATKLIGFFRNREKCIEIKKLYSILPGFRETKKGFKIKKYLLKKEEDVNIAYIYFLQHESSDEQFDYLTDFGVFSTIEEAIKKRDSLISINNPEFKGKEDGFIISKCSLDEPEWSEGFDSDWIEKA